MRKYGRGDLLMLSHYDLRMLLEAEGDDQTEDILFSRSIGELKAELQRRKGQESNNSLTTNGSGLNVPEIGMTELV